VGRYIEVCQVDMAVCIEEDVVRLYVPGYHEIASTYARETIDGGKAGESAEIGVSKFTCG
jgi:hypothetical protein